MGPALILFLLFIAYPIIRGIVLSFYDASPRYKEFVGLKNWTFLFHRKDFQMAMRNTLGYFVVGVPIMTVLPLVIAVMAYNMSTRFQKSLRCILYLPVLTPMILISTIWRWMFQADGGLINSILGKRILWIGSNPEAFWSVNIVAVVTGLGLPVIIYMAALTQVDKELLEAAKADGANQRQILFRVLMPEMLPMMAFVAIIITIGRFNIWGIIHMLTGGGPAYGTISLINLLYQYSFGMGRYGLGSTVGVLLMLLISFFSIAQYRLFKRLHA